MLSQFKLITSWIEVMPKENYDEIFVCQIRQDDLQFILLIIGPMETRQFDLSEAADGYWEIWHTRPPIKGAFQFYEGQPYGESIIFDNISEIIDQIEELKGERDAKWEIVKTKMLRGEKGYDAFIPSIKELNFKIEVLRHAKNKFTKTTG